MSGCFLKHGVRRPRPLIRHKTTPLTSTENQPTFNTCNGHISHELQMINTAARLVRAHLEFCTSLSQTQ